MVDPVFRHRQWRRRLSPLLITATEVGRADSPESSPWFGPHRWRIPRAGQKGAAPPGRGIRRGSEEGGEEKIACIVSLIGMYG
jgi:hypothetical protein